MVDIKVLTSAHAKRLNCPRKASCLGGGWDSRNEPVSNFPRKRSIGMRARVHRCLTAGLVPRGTILGVLGALLAIAPMGALTPAAHAATGTITQFNNSNRPGIIQNSSSHPLGLPVGLDGDLWFTDA